MDLVTPSSRLSGADIPTCPVCGGAMVRTTAHRGPRAGMDFWGCRAWPKTGCPGKINIDDTSAAEPLPAGAPAQAIFEAKREKAIVHRRAQLPAMVGFFVVIMVAEFLIVWPVNAWAAAGLIVFTLLAFLKFFTELPDDALNSERGAKGERATEGYLDGLGPNFVSIHNRWLAGVKGDIDHVAIGPPGVFVIDSKASTAQVDVYRDHLLFGDHDRQEWVDQVAREAIAVQIALKDVLDAVHHTVTPIMCVHGRGPGLGRTAGGVHVLSGSQMARTIASAPTVFTAEDVQRIAVIADQRLKRQRP